MATRSRPSKGYINMASVYRTWADGDAFTAADAGTYFMRQVNISVDNQSDRDAILTPQEGMQVWRKDLDGFELYDGSEWNLVPRLLKKVTLGTAGDTISVTGIPARDDFKIKFFTFSTGGTIAENLRFNNDAGANYAFHYQTAFTGATNLVSQGTLGVAPGGAATQGAHFGVYDVVNLPSQRKIIFGVSTDDNNANATSSSNHVTTRGKWSNTSTQINRVDLLNGGTGDFAVGSYVEIWG